MEAVSTSETSVNIYQTTRRNIPEDSRLQEPGQSASVKFLGETMTCLFLAPNSQVMVSLYIERHVGTVNGLTSL
jgi:hypothetical protein